MHPPHAQRLCRRGISAAARPWPFSFLTGEFPAHAKACPAQAQASGIGQAMPGAHARETTRENNQRRESLISAAIVLAAGSEQRPGNVRPRHRRAWAVDSYSAEPYPIRELGGINKPIFEYMA